MRLANKVAVVTGAGSGFGAAIALQFGREGASVMLADINLDKAKDVASSIASNAGKAEAMRCDVAMQADWQEMVAETVTRYGRIDIVVNNAGTTHRNQPALAVSETDFDRVFTVNVKSIFWSAKVVFPHFEQQGGGVMINIASATGIRPGPGLTWYSASKAAMINLSKGLALEAAKHKIRVNAINPMIGETALLTDFMGAPDTPESRQRFLQRIPLQRFTRPEDVALAALYLASDEAAYITGISLDVDGGRSI
jgi:NAD(P)-dependent dehydrogenase (short-subunit alcohol dehydrogenase family)